MNNKYSEYITVNFYEDDIEVSNNTKSILFEVLNKLIEKLPNYNDFISASLSVFIILTPIRYSYDDVNFNLIKITDKETNQTIKFDLKNNNITYNNTQPYIIYAIDDFNSNNYDEKILNSYDWFDYYHKHFLKDLKEEDK